MPWVRFGVGFILFTSAIGLFIRPFLKNEFFLVRDIAHYYHPLFAYVHEEWMAGRIPLWNGAENLGQPLAADVTASVFYPAKICFVLPFSYERNFLVYLALHALLACWGAYRLARYCKAGCEASGLAAASYLLGGHVLFQYCNVVYFVSAAWLPWSLLMLFAWLRRGGPWALMAWGMSLAGMVLGGDPQMAVHVVLLAGVASAYFAWVTRKQLSSSRILRQSAGRIASGVLLAFGLAAVQILPSCEWAQFTDRAPEESPRSIWEWCLMRSETTSWTDLIRGTCAPPEPYTHRYHQYRFSVAPWRWLELLCPNWGGKSFPENRRWLQVIPGEGQAWTPSLYAGLLPALLAIPQLWSPSRSRQRRVWRMLTWFALLASLGWYGIGWLWLEMTHAIGWQATLDAPVGGIYWSLSLLVPGYTFFRYPAKWWTCVSLLLSLGAAWGWDRALRRPRFLIYQLGLTIVVAIAMLVGMAWYCAEVAGALQSRIGPHVLWGPFDAAGAIRDWQTSWLHVALVSGLAAGWLHCVPKERWGVVVVALTCLELAAAHAWMLPTVSVERFRERPKLVDTLLPNLPADDLTLIPPIVYDRQGGCYPAEWASYGDLDRYVEVVAAERQLLLPKYHLRYPLRAVRSLGSALSFRFDLLGRVAQKEGPIGMAGLRNLLGVQHVVRRDPHQNSAVVASDDQQSFAWIVHQTEAWPPESTADHAKRVAQWILSPERHRSHAVLPPNVQPLELEVVGSEDREQESVVCTRYAAGRIELHARLRARGMVVIAETPAPGWSVHDAKRTESRPPLPVNWVMQGVVLETGDHDLVFEYRPLSFQYGMMITLATLLVCFVVAVLLWRRLCCGGEPQRA